jgi:hypothetical protein
MLFADTLRANILDIVECIIRETCQERLAVKGVLGLLGKARQDSRRCKSNL